MNATWLETPPNKHLIGHRGAAGLKPENTILSLQTAIAAGLNWVEVDAQATKCGQWACIHDNTLDRTTNGTGLIIDHSLEELQNLEAALWFSPPMRDIRIPSIKEVVKFAHFNRIILNIEVKNTEDDPTFFAKSFIDYLLLNKSPSSFSNLLISSFDLDFLCALRKKIPNIPIAYLVEEVTINSNSSFDIIQKYNFQMLNANIQTTSLEHLFIAHELNIPMSLYTCNDSSLAEHWLSHGVWGLFTDFPYLIAGK